MTVPGFPEMSIISNLDRGRRRARRGRRWRIALAHRSRLHGTARGAQHAARARAAGLGRRYQLRQHVSGPMIRLAGRAQAADRRARGQAPGEPFLDRQAAAGLPGPRERRSARAAGCAASDRPHPPRDRPQGALSRPPLRRLHSASCRSPRARRCWMSYGSTRPAQHLAWTQRWQLGDLVVWDNRCTPAPPRGLRRPRPAPPAPPDDPRASGRSRHRADERRSAGARAGDRLIDTPGGKPYHRSAPDRPRAPAGRKSSSGRWDRPWQAEVTVWRRPQR